MHSEDDEQNQSPVFLVVAAGRGKGGGQETLLSFRIWRAGCHLEEEVGLYDRAARGNRYMGNRLRPNRNETFLRTELLERCVRVFEHRL